MVTMNVTILIFVADPINDFCGKRYSLLPVVPSALKAKRLVISLAVYNPWRYCFTKANRLLKTRDTSPIAVMNTLRLARVAARTRTANAIRLPLQRRTYADAVSDKIKLTLALPHQVHHLFPSSPMGLCQRLNALLILNNHSVNLQVHRRVCINWTC